MVQFSDPTTDHLLCWPVLNPQISGEPAFPGEDTVNASTEQSPMEPPKKNLDNI